MHKNCKRMKEGSLEMERPTTIETSRIEGQRIIYAFGWRRHLELLRSVVRAVDICDLANEPLSRCLVLDTLYS